MATDLPDLHVQALDHTQRYIEGVAADQWDDPSVDDEWTVRQLVNHVVSGNLWVPELVAGKSIEEVGDRLDGDLLGADPAKAYEVSASAAAGAFRDDAVMDQPVAVSYGPVPASVYCGHRLIDVLIHGWDVAKSTGQDTNLPYDLVEACWEIVEPDLEALTASGAFGTPASVPPGADRQTQLLAALGRTE
jgi:uncharacterized protein (TIGR03086 family)